MIPYQRTTLHSESTMGLNCSDCGTATQLFGIEAERLGYELLTFVCPKCEHIETSVAKIASLNSCL